MSLFSILLLVLAQSPANAIENGSDATGSNFVVPIAYESAPGKFGGCSGALIAPSIVITAAHCAVDDNGLINSKIYVGDPGSKSDTINTSDIVKEVKMTSSYQNGTFVAADDIAFLILGKPKLFTSKIELASEAEILALSAAKTSLRIFGYGRTSNLDTSNGRFPSSGNGSFAGIGSVAKQPDTAIYLASKGNSCSGDSGGPVLSITATRILLVGIITGGNSPANAFCSSTYSTFTLVNRYTNLAFAIARSQMDLSQIDNNKVVSELNIKIEELNSSNKKITDAANTLLTSFNTLKTKYNENVSANDALVLKYNDAVTAANKTINEVNALNLDAWAKNKLLSEENATLTTKISSYEVQISSLEGEIDVLKGQIDELNSKLPKTITCVKGSLSKKVTALKPKCPSGYKLKAA
jgi:V8-like Glu-specific endopeptidase